MCDAALGGDDDADDLLGTGGSGGSWLGGEKLGTAAKPELGGTDFCQKESGIV